MADHARGEKLRQLRSQRGLSQEEVAAALGVTAKTYGAWERGGGIHVTNARRIARYFKVKAGELVVHEIEQEAPTVTGTVLSADDSERLDRIEEQLDELNRKLDELLKQSDGDEKKRADEKAKAVADAGPTRRKAKRATAPIARAETR